MSETMPKTMFASLAARPVLLLDYDGTLAETRPAIRQAIRAALADMGLPPLGEAALDAHLGQGATLQEFYQQLAPAGSPPDRLSVASAEFVAAYRRHYVQADLEATVLFPDVAETLEALAAQGYVMAALSNKHEPTLKEGIVRFGLEKFFPVVLGAVPDAPRKPEAAVWTRRLAPALKALGHDVAAQACVMVGDTSADLQFARTLAMPSCWATYGHGNSAVCAALSPTCRIDSFAALPAALAAL